MPNEPNSSNEPNYFKHSGIDLNDPNQKAALDKSFNSLASQVDAFYIGQQLQKDWKLADDDVAWAVGQHLDQKAIELAISYLKQAC
jgi:hypothetical protein